MPKISQLPSDASPASTDYVAGVQAGVPGTVRFLLSSLATFFWTLANIPSGATSPITRDNETQFAFVASGLVWSGDSYAVNKNASMTAGVCYINGRRISIAAVTARTFAASVDTYIDVLDNGDGTGTLVYTTAVNNAASAVLAANSLRIGIIVSGATTIAAAGSVNQGQEDKVLPIASSIAYSVTDSLGNLICSRDPANKLLGLRQIVTTFSTSSATAVQITGLTLPVIVPTNRKVKLSLYTPNSNNTVGASTATIEIWDGAVGGTRLSGQDILSNLSTNLNTGGSAIAIRTPTTASKTYNGSLLSTGANNITLNGASTKPIFIMAELE